MRVVSGYLPDDDRLVKNGDRDIEAIPRSRDEKGANKSPEPTSCAVTPRAMEMKSKEELESFIY